MNIPEHLLTVLGEEGAEVAQQVSKALRFGLNDVNTKHPDGPNNRERLVTELNQLIAVADMCVEAGLIPKDWLYSQQSRSTQKLKREAVETFMNYAMTKGTLR